MSRYKKGDTRRALPDLDIETEGTPNSEGCSGSADKLGESGPEDAVAQGSSSKHASDTGHESAGFVGSTVADAIYVLVQTSHFRVSDTAIVTSVDFPDVPTRAAQLSGSSKALIIEYFEEATPVRLSPGHATIALNEGQVSHTLKVVADEAVRSSLKSMKS